MLTGIAFSLQAFYLEVNQARADHCRNHRPMARRKKKGKTPLMRQFHKIKERHPNALLLFRMGDFYETFHDDAKTLSDTLGITLTSRSSGKAADVPMAGFPHHALDKHLPKLIRGGLRVAICEQLEDPKYAKKVVKRDVVEVVTPGVSFHDQLLSPRRSNYLAAVHWDGKGVVGYAYIDASTGEFCAAEAPEAKVGDVLETIAPAEVIIDKRRRKHLEGKGGHPFVLTPQEDWVFTYDFAKEVLLRHFQTHSLKGYGVEDLDAGQVAAGAALHYLSETQKGRVPHIRRIRRYSDDAFMALDAQTKRNLELVTSMQQGNGEGALINILDETTTAGGGRLLRQWLVRPLHRKQAIERRLEGVASLVDNRRRRGKLREEMGEVGDLERLAAKVATGRASPRDLIAIKQTLLRVPSVKRLLADDESEALATWARALTPCAEVVEGISEALVDDPPAGIGDGGLIREGYNDELDEVRAIAHSGKDWVAQLEAEESSRTGIPSLKVGFNKVFGYYLEVTNTHKNKVPETYIRKQTLVNSERYITPELKEYEEKILTAEEKTAGLELRLFQELREAVAEHTEALQVNAGYLSMLDCLAALAEVAERSDYTRPEVHDGRRIGIEGGRHPVVEVTLPPGEPFIPNDTVIDPDAEQILLITGPNMAGKSVVLRQAGLIVLLAQVGSFVPAKSARVGLVDRIFTRVGASDNLAAGESTFLVEMNETANILNNATPRSLILLDEVGRGTSTFDGLSIAWALVEYLHENAAVAARTLFATHFHELNELAERFPRIRNFRVQVKEHDDRVIFLRKLVPGGADHSYGIEVARMAGLPATVVRRAKEVLAYLEEQHVAVAEAPERHSNGRAPKSVKARVSPAGAEDGPPQMHLFAGPGPDPAAAELKSRLKALDTNRITPVEALLTLTRWKDMLESERKDR